MEKKAIMDAKENIESYCMCNDREVDTSSVPALLSLIRELSSEHLEDFLDEEPEYVHDMVSYIESASILIQSLTDED